MSNLLDKMKRMLKDRDAFAHDVSLNFNNKGNKHKTLIGGISSIIIKGFMIFYFINLCNKVDKIRGDSISTNTLQNNLLKFDGEKIT